MHSSTKLISPLSILFFDSCDKVYLKQAVSFRLYQVVLSLENRNLNPLNKNLSYTVINEHGCQLMNCSLSVNIDAK